MPLHLAELKKHTEQNTRIIELLEKLTETQLPIGEFALDKTKKTREKAKPNDTE